MEMLSLPWRWQKEVVSSDHLRGVVGSGEHDLDASAEAFAFSTRSSR
jgi:hypothetical protein